MFGFVDLLRMTCWEVGGWTGVFFRVKKSTSFVEHISNVTLVATPCLPVTYAHPALKIEGSIVHHPRHKETCCVQFDVVAKGGAQIVFAV